jgi:CheY-specific phosphatase CheX
MIDAMCEITNMLAGSVKARVAGYATHAALGLPTFVHGPIEAASSTVVDVVPIAVDDLTAFVIIVRAIDA